VITVAVFWMIYGGTKKDQDDPNSGVVVEVFESPGRLFFGLFRITIGDSYDYDVSIEKAFITYTHTVARFAFSTAGLGIL
jgi:hypothetical protein